MAFMLADTGPQLLRDWISRAALRDPRKAWIVSADDGRTVTYRQLRDITARIATVLHERGITAQDRVALLANNSIEHLLCYFGVMSYGATICTVHVEMNRNQLDNIFARLKPKLILYQHDLQLDDLFAGVPAPRQPLGHWDSAASETFYGEVAAAQPSEAQSAAS